MSRLIAFKGKHGPLHLNFDVLPPILKVIATQPGVSVIVFEGGSREYIGESVEVVMRKLEQAGVGATN